MNPATLQPPSLRNLLFSRLVERQSELSAVLQQAAGAAAASSDHPAEVLDFKDIALQETQSALDDAAQAHAREELNQVGAALRRMEQGSYGVCQECGEPIADLRLQALPATPYCTACQLRHEQAPARRA